MGSYETRRPHYYEPAINPHFARFASRRSVVYSTKGMIAASQPLAAAAGLAILNKGGNAADAAVAVSAALNVTEPCSCGIGGDAFCLYFDAKTKKISALNGSGRAPQALSLAKARELGLKGREIPFFDINSVTVPGAAAAWCDTIDKFGSGKIKVADALQPAIELAENGYPVSEITSYAWRKAHKQFLKASPNGKEMLIVDPKTGDTHAPNPGEVFKNPTLAATFREVASKGKKGFYEGRIAEAIVEVIKQRGGVMSMDDLASHTSTPTEPISVAYGGPEGVTLHEHQPNGQGIVAVIALGIINELEEQGVINLKNEEHNGVVWIHTIIEALRIAFADAHAYVADPEKAKVPIKQLISKSYFKERAKLFDPKKSNPNIKKGKPFGSSDTVLFTTADAEGNACSFIQSNFAGFGTYAVPKGCGFTLQNRGSGFALEEGHPNCVEGGKRPYHTIIPALVTKGDKPGGDLFMTFGVMGGFMQPQGHVQVLLNMLHHGFDAQNALDAPRICIAAGPPTENVEELGDISSDTYLEEGISEQVRDELVKIGHKVEFLSGWQRGTFGRGQVIQRLPGGVWAGGSDPRADGHAVPQI